MDILDTSLLREKFVIHDTASGKNAVIATSNRLVIDLKHQSGAVDERFVVRAQNMHSCVKLAAELIRSYNLDGPLLSRGTPYDWGKAWSATLSDYETDYNRQRWAAIYSNGKIVFAAGEYHTFLDVLEQCQASNRSHYEASVALAEQSMRQSGKPVRVDYDGNVALNLDLKGPQGRIGVIVRGPTKTATFNFAVSTKGRALSIPQVMYAAAAFLEGIQLAFTTGMNNEKLRRSMIPADSDDAKRTKAAPKRLQRLNSEIAELEGAYDVRYRPERPEFKPLLDEAEHAARDIFKTKK